MTSSVTSFAYFAYFQTQISPELMQIFANGKQHFYSFMEFYVMQLKNQGVKFWSLLEQNRQYVYRVQHFFTIAVSLAWLLLSNVLKIQVVDLTCIGWSGDFSITWNIPLSTLKADQFTYINACTDT